MAGLTKQYYTLNGRILGEEVIGGSGVRNYLTDALGSVVHTVTPAGAIENSYAYKPFGGPLAKGGATSDPVFTWNGCNGYRATARGFAEEYVESRHYATQAARWISVDALWPGQPAYAYAESSPVAKTDPSGTACQGSLADQLNDYFKSLANRINRLIARDPLTPCERCAMALFSSWWGSKQHWCNHRYVHCYTCCKLAKKFGPDCANNAQKFQNTFPILRGSQETQLTRGRACAQGIYSGGLRQDCHWACIKAYPPPPKPPGCPHTPPPYPPGCP